MLMLTHTWILKEFIGSGGSNDEILDLFTYNISPDILCFHKEVTSDLTHGIPRFCKLPYEYRKAAFVHFHLLVDDIAHHGKISSNISKAFNPHSDGYTYVKGRPLIEPLSKFYQEIDKDISFDDISYQSHMIIEMMFDLALQNGQDDDNLSDLFLKSIQYTVRDKIDEYSKTVGWILGIRKDIVENAIQGSQQICTAQRMRLFNSLDGKINAFMNRFGLDRNDHCLRKGIEDIMDTGMELVADYEDFLYPTISSIKNAGFTYSL